MRLAVIRFSTPWPLVGAAASASALDAALTWMRLAVIRFSTPWPPVGAAEYLSVLGVSTTKAAHPPKLIRAEASSHGTLTKLTTVDGSVPDAHAWPPTVRGTIVVFSILVRSTTAAWVASPFAITATASPVAGL